MAHTYQNTVGYISKLIKFQRSILNTEIFLWSNTSLNYGIKSLEIL